MKEDINKETYDIISFIMQNSNDYVVVLNDKFEIDYINEDIYLKSLGYSKKDIIGKKITSIIHPDDKKLIFDKNTEKRLFDSKIVELHVKHKNGQWNLFEVKSKVLTSTKDGLKTILMLREISKKEPIEKEKNEAFIGGLKLNGKILMKTEEKYHNLIESLPFSIVLLDSNGIIKDCNYTTTRVLGYPKDELIGKIFSEFSITLKENLHFLFDYFKNNPESSELLILEAQFKKKDGNLIWTNMQSSLVTVDSEIMMQVMFYNISEQKRAEDLIREEIEKLKELEKIRKDLVSSVSHELKTPLMTISGASELLLEVYISKADEDALDLVKMIDRGSRRLASLVERFFDISRLELDSLNLENKECNLSTVIQDCSNEMKYLLKRREIALNLNLQADLSLEVDKLRIEQVFMNLLSNAIKNTPPRGKIDISLKKNEDWAEISVKDTGVGLTENELNRLIKFTRFSKLERQGPGTEYLNIQGSGLGLYITKKIVDLYDGEINVKSDGRNKGSTFIIKLPINQKKIKKL
ncbi:MAG: PAS domain S-box protein [Promethearchaeota archaeon]